MPNATGYTNAQGWCQIGEQVKTWSQDSGNTSIRFKLDSLVRGMVSGGTGKLGLAEGESDLMLQGTDKGLETGPRTQRRYSIQTEYQHRT